MPVPTPIAARIWDSFRRHTWLFLIALVVVSGTSIAILALRAKTYEATALTQVTTEDVATELGDAPAATYVVPAQQNVAHFQDLVSDNLPGGFLDTALRNAQLARPLSLDPKDADPRYALLKKRLTAAVQSDSVWTISLTWDSPAECERIVSALQKQYIEEIGQSRSAQAVATGSFLDSQIAQYASRMSRAEQALIDYKKQNAGELPEAQSADISQLSNLKAELDNLQITARDNDLKKGELQKRMAQIKPLSILEQTSSENPYEAQIKTLMAKRDVLLAEGKLPTHPLVASVSGQIDYLQKSLASKVKAHSPEADNVTQTKLQDNPEFQGLQQQMTDAVISGQTQQAQIQHLQQAIAQYQTRIQRIPAEQRNLTDKTRDYSIVKAQYESLLARREQIKVKGALDKVSASSLFTPLGQVYAEPTTGRSKTLGLMAGSIVLGILVGIVLIVLAEWGDPSLRTESDAERLLGVPVLGLVPDSADLKFRTSLALPGSSYAALPSPPPDDQNPLAQLEGASR